MKRPQQLAALVLLPFIALAAFAQGGTTNDSPLPGLVRLKMQVGYSYNPSDVQALLERSLPEKKLIDVSSWIRPEMLVAKPEAVLQRPMAESVYRQPALSSLRRILVVHFAEGEDMLSLADLVGTIPGVEYAEPVWPRQLSVLPNDVLLNEQFYLEQLHLTKAWELARADATVVIAVIDSGIDPLHPDLADAIWHNPGESGKDTFGRDRQTNGRDDDNNGFIDDWWGYDFAGREGVGQDNSPIAWYPHGVHVAGIAAATGNNQEGVAGVGYGAKIMPLKVTADTSRDNPPLVHPYEAILYAGRMGAQIINCSWGGTGKSLAEQEIIDAVTDMGSLVVAAAGNQGRGIPTYPAAYGNVLSVGSVNSEDMRSIFSNYHETVDLVAPGENVLSTIPVVQGSYGKLSGTSMAAPMVSGAAALILSQYAPNTVTPQQLSAILKSSADDVDKLNPQFRALLGAGRLNVERSIEIGLNAVYAEIVDYQTVDIAGDGFLDAGDEFDLNITLHNILAACDKLRVEARIAENDILSLVDSTVDIPPVASGEITTNALHPFRFRIAREAPFDQVVPLELTVRKGDGTISVTRLELLLNPSYSTTNANRLAVTFSGNGRIGFIDFPANRYGDGFRLDGSTSMLSEGGLLVGTDPEHLVSTVRKGGATAEEHGLQTVLPFRVNTEGGSDVEIGRAQFNDAHLPAAEQVGVDISLETYSYTTPGREKQILLLYTLRNTSGKPLDDLHCALLFDWDLGVRGRENRTIFDPLNRMGYTAHISDPGQPVVGAMLLSDATMNFSALNNKNDLLLSQREKWYVMSQRIGPDSSEIGDNSMLIGAGPLHLAAGDSTVVAFALLAGGSVGELQGEAEEMRALYRERGGTPGGPITVIRRAAFSPSQPNPFRDATVIRYQIPYEKDVRLEMYDISGKHVSTLVNESQRQGIYEVRFVPPPASNSSIWIARLYAAGEIFAEKLIQLDN